jgi:hypothetical protein
MPRKPQRARKRDAKYNIVVSMPGWLKNEIVDLCRREKTGINQWALWVLKRAVDEAQGLPPAPEPKAGMPTVADELRAYLAGEKIMYPCGRTDCEPEIEQLQNHGFCKKCGVRAY